MKIIRSLLRLAFVMSLISTESANDGDQVGLIDGLTGGLIEGIGGGLIGGNGVLSELLVGRSEPEPKKSENKEMGNYAKPTI